MISSFHNSIHPPEMVIEPSMTACGCHRRWRRKRLLKLKTNKTNEQTKQQQQTNKQKTHGYARNPLTPVECI